MLLDLQHSMNEKAITLSWDENVQEYLAEKAYSAVFGARNLRRFIQKELEDVITLEIIEHHETQLNSVHVTVADDKIQIQPQFA